MLHSNPRPSPDAKLLTAFLTTAGVETFSERLKGWTVFEHGTGHLDPVSMDPLLVSKCVRVVRGKEGARNTVVSLDAGPSLDWSWFEKAMQPAAGPLAPAAIVPIIAGLTDMLKANYFDEVDRLLKSFKVRNAAPEMMVALLRTTFPLRRRPLRHWGELLREVRSELERRHLDAPKVLRGLV